MNNFHPLWCHRTSGMYDCEPATDIDHIHGSKGNELENLQPLCGECHRQKSIAAFSVLTPDNPIYEACMRRKSEYFNRAQSSEPQRFCDNDLLWPGVWRELSTARSLKRALVPYSDSLDDDDLEDIRGEVEFEEEQLREEYRAIFGKSDRLGEELYMQNALSGG